MNKTLVVVNPASAFGRTRREWPAIARELDRNGLKYEACITGHPREAEQLTRKALQEGYETIIATGGDGTLNEVVNGFFVGSEGKPVNPEARLGLISSGTGRDFFRSLDYPSDVGEAARIIARGNQRYLDVGKVLFTNYEGRRETRYFINVAGLGVDAETVERVNRTSKRLGGRISFLWGTVCALVQYHNREVRLEVDGQLVHQGKVLLVAVANGQYIGGGMRIAPEARLDSGYFDVIWVGDMGKLEALTVLPRIYSGAHMGHPGVRIMRGTHIKASSPEKVLIQMDGEQPGILDAEFSMLEHKLPLLR